MSKVIFLTDKALTDSTDYVLHKTFGEEADIITVELNNILEDYPLERLKALIYRYNGEVRALVCDVPLSVLEVLMVSRQYLGVSLYVATYESDSQGFPKLELTHEGEVNLKISGFRELRQLLVSYGPTEHKRHLSRDIHADMDLVVHW